MDQEQMTMRKCVSCAPDQPRLILAEKRMLVGRQRDKLHLPHPLGLDKPWVAQNSGVLLYSFWSGDMPVSGLVSCMVKRNQHLGVRKRRSWTSTASREFNPCTGLLMLLMNGGQQQERLLSLGGCTWLIQSSHHIDVSHKGKKVICVHLVHCNSVVTVTLAVLHLQC